jgi:glycosyltransferase involved in cell wall biosynthesis
VRITFVIPKPNLSGGMRVIAIYADRLAKCGHQVTVVSTPSARRPQWQRIKSFLATWNPWRAQATSCAGLMQPQDGSHFDRVDVPHIVIDRFRPIIDSDVPDGDVVIATWWRTAEWVAKLSPRKGAKAYFIQHHEIFDYLPIERVKATWRMPLHKITISKWLVELAAREYGDCNVWLVPNSVDKDQFFALPRGHQARPTVGLLYSTVKWKGVEVSLKAIALARKRIPSLRLIAFGAEPVSDLLPLPKADFYYRPSQDAIRNLYASCDVWLCGSYSEGFHLPPLEAMACRCPVVSTSVGGPVDIIKNGRNGFLVPIGNAEALADRLIDVLSLSDAQWRAMSDAALATTTNFTWDDATCLFEKALREIVDASTLPRTEWSTAGMRLVVDIQRDLSKRSAD